MKPRVLSILAVWLLSLAALRASSLFTITETRFVALSPGGAIRVLQAQDKLRSWETLQIEITIRGGPIALSCLQRCNSLSVVSRWWNGSEVTDENIEIGLKPENWQHDRASIEEQVADHGSFIWHTFASKANWNPGLITVSCSDQNHALAQIQTTHSAETRINLLN